MRIVEGLGREVFPHPYHIPATPAPRRSGPAALMLNSAVSTRLQPSRSQGLQAGANADAFSEHLACNCRRLAVEGVQDSELQAVHRQAIGEFVVELFLSDSRLRNA